MRFDFETLAAKFMARPNRFVVVAQLHGSREVVRAHCADPGRMRELLLPGSAVHLSRSAKPGRKTAYDLRFVEHPASGQLISVNSQLANRLFAEAVRDRALEPFACMRIARSEASAPADEDAPTGVRSRFDFVLKAADGRSVWVEVKSATLVEERVALFPDARTERGRRHVLELARLRQDSGEKAAVVFVVQRPDADELRPQRDIDPAFTEALYFASEQGVELYAFTCRLTTQEMEIDRRIPVAVWPPD